MALEKISHIVTEIMSSSQKPKSHSKDAEDKKKKKGKDKGKEPVEVIETVEIVDLPEGPISRLGEREIAALMSHLSHFMLFRSMRVSKLWNSAGRKVKLNEFDVRTFAGNFEDDHLNSIVTRYPDLHTVRIHAAPRLTEKGIKHLSKLSSLSILDVSNCRNLGDGALLKMPLANAQKLVSLKVSHCGFADRGLKLGLLPLLTSLDLSYCDGITNRLSLHLAQYTPGLTNLDISSCPTLSNDFMIGVAKISSLKIFKMRFCTGMDHNAIGILCDPTQAPPNESLPALTTFDASHTLLNNPGLVKLCKTFPTLNELSASFCHRIDDEGTADLTSLQQLKILNLSYTGISFTTLERIKGLAHLSDLIVAGCKGLNPQIKAFTRSNPQLRIVFQTTTKPSPDKNK